MYRVTVAASGRRRPPPVESWTPQRESGREHHIVDEAGDEIGRAIELPKLRRWKQVPGIHRGDVRLAIYDSDGIKLLELVRPPGSYAVPQSQTATARVSAGSRSASAGVRRRRALNLLRPARPRENSDQQARGGLRP